MRLWLIHPKYLDSKGLVALWREALLAKKVLEGKTKGYKNHPELKKFKALSDPLLAINSYLYYVYLEAKSRDYKFNLEKIDIRKIISRSIEVDYNLVQLEFLHLCKKLKKRDCDRYNSLCRGEIRIIECHPVFKYSPNK